MHRPPGASPRVRGRSMRPLWPSRQGAGGCGRGAGPTGRGASRGNSPSRPSWRRGGDASPPRRCIASLRVRGRSMRPLWPSRQGAGGDAEGCGPNGPRDPPGQLPEQAELAPRQLLEASERRQSAGRARPSRAFAAVACRRVRIWSYGILVMPPKDAETCAGSARGRRAAPSRPSGRLGSFRAQDRCRPSASRAQGVGTRRTQRTQRTRRTQGDRKATARRAPGARKVPARRPQGARKVTARRAPGARKVPAR